MQQPQNDNTPSLDPRLSALNAVAAAAALRSESSLWPAIEAAAAAGASWEELEAAIEQAAAIAETAVRQDGLRTLREARAHLETKARWQ